MFKDRIEVSLDGRQIFYLFFGGAVVATLVFVLGVMVGRQVESRTTADTTTSVTRDPLAALDQLEGESELSFPAALRGDAVRLGDVDESLAKRTLIRAEPKTVIVAAPPKPADKEADKNAEEKASDAKASKAAKLAAETQAANAKLVAQEAKLAAKLAADRRFTLQVGSFQDKSEADTFFRQLAQTSYKPYMVEAEIPGKGQYYRVRVGGFSSFDDAVEAKAQFEDSQHVIAYVTRLKKK